MIFMKILNPNNESNILIVFHDMTADMISKKTFNPISELFTRGKKNRYSSYFYYKVLFSCSQKNQTKFYALFYYENPK